MRRFAPVLVLAVLAVAVPEILFGSTPLTEPNRILVTLPIYAGGAVLIRELARRQRVGWLQIALLGVVYGIVEEGLALGSLFNPALFNAGLVGGRLLGVNWTWTEWTLGYHAVWSISIPILLAELLFPARRAETWLGSVGLAVAGLVYLAGVLFMALIFRFVVAPDFVPPLIPYGAAILVALGIAALALRGSDTSMEANPAPERSVPAPWLVGLLALIAAGVWFELLLLPRSVKSGPWIVVPMVLALGLVVGLTILVRRWSMAGAGWTDLHRLALAAGALPVSMLYGYQYVTAGQPAAHVGQVIASGLAIVLLAVFGWRLRGRRALPDSGGHPGPRDAEPLAAIQR